MKVFLSYNSTDEPIATRLAEALAKEGAEVWTQSELLPGDNWGEEVARALRESDAMVVLITPESMESAYVHREIEYALGQIQYKARLVPLYVGDRERIDETKVPWILRKLSAVELPNPEDQTDAERAADEISRLLAASAP